MDIRFSKQVRNIISQRSKERGGRVVKLLIARQNFDAAEIEFADMLMEDHNNAALAYPDCALSALIIISHRPTRTIRRNFDVSDI